MSAAKTASSSSKLDYRVKAGGPWSGAWKLAAVVGALGAVGTVAGYLADPQRFAFSYMFAFVFFLTIGLGGLCFVLLQHLTSAGWSVTVRRTAEFFMAGLPVFAALFIPILFVMGHLFPWLHADHAAAAHHAATAGEHASGEHGTEHGTSEHATGGHGAGRHEVAAVRAPESEEVREHAEHVHLLTEKKPYLNIGFFLARAVLYFLAWSWLSVRLFTNSTQQDTTKDPQLTVRSQRIAPVATFIFGLTLTFAAFDWIMSLQPTWYSTIFGVTIFAGSILTMFALIILVTLSLRASGLIGDAVNVEHYHDLGKLLFGFLVFWAYVSFSQFFLIWYAGIPEETTFYHQRWGTGSWKYVSLFLLFGHFVLPLMFLLSRNIKRRTKLLAFGAGWIVLMHMVEIYWLVLPNYRVDPLLPNALPSDNSGILAPHWMDLACLAFVGGVYLALVFRRLATNALIPVGDPRLSRALRFENF